MLRNKTYSKQPGDKLAAKGSKKKRLWNKQTLWQHWKKRKGRRSSNKVLKTSPNLRRWKKVKLIPYGLLNKPNLMGRGRSDPPLLYGYPRTFLILFFNRGLVMDVKGQNPKAQPSTIKIVAPRNYWKIINFGKNPKKLKILYLEIRLFIHKSPARIKPRHIGCSGFL